MRVLVEVREGVHWVGAIDWNIRNFHGYYTPRGTTYNAYLVVDEKVALIDTVKENFYPEMIRRVGEVIDPDQIDYIVINHIEPDHAGALDSLKEAAEEAEIIVSDRGRSAMQRYHGGLKFTTIKERPEVGLGGRTLRFIPMPMLHWPDSMATYIPEEGLLLPNDAFGQHLATSRRFDDEVDPSLTMREAAKYYANIVMPYWKVVLRVLDVLKELEIEAIAPSHGVIWRSRPREILDAYRRWAEGAASESAVIAYDTMWGSTELLARALADGLLDEGVEVQLRKLTETHYSDVVADVLEARALLVGSPTLNSGLYPTVAEFLSYLKGLRPKGKIGAVFGSTGWGGGAKRAAEEELRAAGVELVESGLDITYRPTAEELRKAREFGREMARRVKSWTSPPSEQ